MLLVFVTRMLFFLRQYLRPINVSGSSAKFRCIWAISKLICYCNQNICVCVCVQPRNIFYRSEYSQSELASCKTHRLHRTRVATRMKSFHNIGFHIKYATDAKHRIPIHTTRITISHSNHIICGVCLCVWVLGHWVEVSLMVRVSRANCLSGIFFSLLCYSQILLHFSTQSGTTCERLKNEEETKSLFTICFLYLLSPIAVAFSLTRCLKAQ